MTNEQTEAIELVNELNANVSGLREDVRQVKKERKRDRNLIVGLAVSVVFDVILSIVLGVVAVRAEDASNKANEAAKGAVTNAQSQHDTCVTSNEVRAKQTELWNFVINLAESNPNKPVLSSSDQDAADQRTNAFRVFIADTFKQRNCDKETPLTSTTKGN